MRETALNRLMKTAGASTPQTQDYTLDEQLGSNTDDDFIGAMSPDAAHQMFDNINRLEYREDESDDDVDVEDYGLQPHYEDDEQDEDQGTQQQYVEQKRGRGRPRKTDVDEQLVQKQYVKQTVYSEPQKQEPPSEYTSSINLSQFMDSLAKDLIDELRVSNYSTRNFSHSQMLTILNYIEQKI